jgi:hypothetical protein
MIISTFSHRILQKTIFQFQGHRRGRRGTENGDCGRGQINNEIGGNVLGKNNGTENILMNV